VKTQLTLQTSQNENFASRDFHESASNILEFFEATSWPLRLERLLLPDDKENFNDRVESLLKLIESNPVTRDEWLAFTVPGKKEGEGGSATKTSAIERIRLFGPQKTRTYLVGALLRAHPDFQTKEKLDWLNSPFPSWRNFERIFGNSEVTFDLQVECALIFELFQGWLKKNFPVADAARTRRWLDKQIESWVRLWKTVSANAKSGDDLPASLIFKQMLFFDLGRAVMVGYSDKSASNWANAEKSKQEVHVTLFLETQTHGFCSAQIAAVWSQCLSTNSNLATPLRLMMRPWRSAHPQLILSQAKSGRVLCEWMERKIS